MDKWKWLNKMQDENDILKIETSNEACVARGLYKIVKNNNQE